MWVESTQANSDTAPVSEPVLELTLCLEVPLDWIRNVYICACTWGGNETQKF